MNMGDRHFPSIPSTQVFPSGTDSHGRARLRACWRGPMAARPTHLTTAGAISTLSSAIARHAHFLQEMEPMDAKEFVRTTVAQHPVVLFMKGTSQFPQCGFSGRAIQLLKSCAVQGLVTVNVLEDEEVRQAVKDFANWPTVPQLYVHGQFVGGSDIMAEMYESGELQELLKKVSSA